MVRLADKKHGRSVAQVRHVASFEGSCNHGRKRGGPNRQVASMPSDTAGLVADSGPIETAGIQQGGLVCSIKQLGYTWAIFWSLLTAHESTNKHLKHSKPRASLIDFSAANFRAGRRLPAGQANRQNTREVAQAKYQDSPQLNKRISRLQASYGENKKAFLDLLRGSFSTPLAQKLLASQRIPVLWVAFPARVAPRGATPRQQELGVSLFELVLVAWKGEIIFPVFGRPRCSPKKTPLVYLTINSCKRLGPMGDPFCQSEGSGNAGPCQGGMQATNCQNLFHEALFACYALGWTCQLFFGVSTTCTTAR